MITWSIYIPIKKNGKRSKNVDFSIATTYIHKFINKGLYMLKCSLIG